MHMSFVVGWKLLLNEDRWYSNLEHLGIPEQKRKGVITASVDAALQALGNLTVGGQDGEEKVVGDDKKPSLDAQSQLLDTGPLTITGPGSEYRRLDIGQHINNTRSSYKAACKALFFSNRKTIKQWFTGTRASRLQILQNAPSAKGRTDYQQYDMDIGMGNRSHEGTRQLKLSTNCSRTSRHRIGAWHSRFKTHQSVIEKRPVLDTTLRPSGCLSCFLWWNLSAEVPVWGAGARTILTCRFIDPAADRLTQNEHASASNHAEGMAAARGDRVRVGLGTPASLQGEQCQSCPCLNALQQLHMSSA
eukprot:1554960-Rhodomonas_salina.1